MTTFDYESAYGDLTTFNGRVIQPTLHAEVYVDQIGGLPEIESASIDLRAAIDQTRFEIEEAEFASRFSSEITPRLRGELDAILQHISPFTRDAVEEEGEAGAKRQELLSELSTVESELFLLTSRLVRLRAHLHISKTEF